MPRFVKASAKGALPQALKDPCNDRVVTSASLPPAESLGLDVAMAGTSPGAKKGKPDIDLLRKHLSAEGSLSQELLFDLIEKAADLFDREPNMLKLEDPITVVGDIHGQYWDLMKLFEVGGMPGDIHYLFLGDYVDRGSFSVEVAAYMFASKVRYPKKVFMLRGNHECRQMTSFFNFREECEYKYDLSIYNAFMEAFDTLPLCATINGKYFAVHGGVSPDLVKLNELLQIDRMQEPPRDGVMCDLIWSDPDDKEDDEKKGKRLAFTPNETRGCSFYFSSEAAAKFLKKNSLLSIIRAHEAQAEGYKMHKQNPATGFPSVITVFSAPNYCDTYNNKAAILKFDNSTLNVLQFNSSPHPYHLPNFMDIFAWSMPFVIEKVMEFAAEVLASQGDLDFGDQPVPDLPPKILEKLNELKGAGGESGNICQWKCSRTIWSMAARVRMAEQQQRRSP
jgi:serine/threonine-protein phosphatase 2B catalytic subunit